MIKHLLAFLFISCTSGVVNNQTDLKESTMQKSSVHQFKVKSITGEEIDFSTFKGKKILIVNTASECGYTPQYEGLENLYTKYKDKLVVVGVPSNDFGAQEPGSNAEIQTFCKKNYGVSFILTEKMNVKGENCCALYKWLTAKSANGVLDATVKWNFNKFLLDEEGYLINYFPSSVTPMSDEIVTHL